MDGQRSDGHDLQQSRFTGSGSDRASPSEPQRLNEGPGGAFSAARNLKYSTEAHECGKPTIPRAFTSTVAFRGITVLHLGVSHVNLSKALN